MALKVSVFRRLDRSLADSTPPPEVAAAARTWFFGRVLVALFSLAAKDLGDEFMSTTPAGSRSSAARTRRHRERRRQRTRCVTVDVNQSERDALVVRGYLSEEDRDNGAAIKKAIEGVISDIVFELQSEAAERCRARV
jgi:hypothetical protein